MLLESPNVIKMTNYKLSANPMHVNVTEHVFHEWAKHYYKCKQDFQPPVGPSPVPYFLLCRSIELEIKSRHLKSISREKVKKEFKHNLIKAYDALDEEQKVLNNAEYSILKAANEIYCDKGFEYCDLTHIVQGLSNFPSLASLDAVAKKIMR